jgi:hypothetical protein
VRRLATGFMSAFFVPERISFECDAASELSFRARFPSAQPGFRHRGNCCRPFRSPHPYAGWIRHGPAPKSAVGLCSSPDQPEEEKHMTAIAVQEGRSSMAAPTCRDFAPGSSAQPFDQRLAAVGCTETSSRTRN